MKTRLPEFMKILSIIFFLFLTPVISFTQMTEMECTISRKSSTEIVLHPAHFDLNSLPIVGSSVHFKIYVDKNTSAGYHEIAQLTVLKWFLESKSIQLLLPIDFENNLKNWSLEKSAISVGEKVKISWNH